LVSNETRVVRLWCLIVLGALVSFLVAHPLVAQTGELAGEVVATEQVEEWNRQAEAARQLVDAEMGGTPGDRLAQLEKARSQIALQRDAALAASRIVPFEAGVAEGKLRLLGDVPEAGETEFAASKRTELEEELYRLKAPQRAFEDSYLRAVATVALLDGRISDLKQDALLRRGDTPLAPSSWVALARETRGKLALLSESSRGSGAGEIESRSAILAIALVGIVIGLVVAILLRRRVVRRLETRYTPDATPARSAVLAIVRDFVALLLLLFGLGIIVLSGALVASLYPDFIALPLLFLSVGAPLLFAHWIGILIFAPEKPELRLVDLGDARAGRAVWAMVGVGAAMGFEALLEYADNQAPFSDAAAGAAPFVVILFLAMPLYGLARIIEGAPADPEPAVGPSPDADDDERFLQTRIQWRPLVTGAMRLSALAALILSMIGYGALARFVIVPTIETLGVLALFTVIYLRLVEFYRFLPALDFTKSRNALTGAKFVTALAFLALAIPIVSLFWGVRAAEIGDFLVLLRDGVTIGGATISLGVVFVFLAVFVIGYVLTRWTQRALQTMLLSRLDMDEGTKSAIVTGTGYIGILVAFVAAVGAAGIDLSNLAIIFGALSVGIGFGMQSIVSNFVSGIIMLVERPIKEGDSIEVGGYAGIVDKISVRATRIQSFDHDDVIIPNSELIAGTVRNRTLTDRMTRIECSVGIAYDADVNAAFDILYAVARGHERTVEDPAPNVVMEQLGDSALMLRLYCFIDEVGKALSTRSEMYVEIVRRFGEAGIAIPYPQRDLHIVGALPEPRDASGKEAT
jgi:small-conductance mechanosensitive channel